MAEEHSYQNCLTQEDLPDSLAMTNLCNIMADRPGYQSDYHHPVSVEQVKEATYRQVDAYRHHIFETNIDKTT